MSINTKEILFSRHVQNSNDLTIDDLNRYLPALRKIEDFTFEISKSYFKYYFRIVRSLLLILGLALIWLIDRFTGHQLDILNRGFANGVVLIIVGV